MGEGQGVRAVLSSSIFGIIPPMNTFPQQEASFIIPGPAGDLEILTASPENITRSTIAIICHPHPVHGGTMTNKVVSTLARMYKELGLRTVRFNFRGVNKSTGEFDNGRGEVDDLKAVIAWVKSVAPESPIALAGFSFGAYIAAVVATQIDAEHLVCVAPPVVNFNMPETISEIPCPWIVVQGDQDEIVSPAAVFEWAEKRNPKPTIIRIENASHFFHGKLLELRESIFAVLSSPN